MTRLALILVVLGLAFALAGAALAISQRRVLGQSECEWGASSIRVEGDRVVAGPDVTGCTP